MRKDIDKVVFERAKANRTWASKTPRDKRVVLDDSGEHINERANHVRRKRQKYRNQHFNAVQRFLVRNVGRRWDKVFSEICASVDSRALLGSEIRQRVEQLVSTKCWLRGRKVISYDWRGCPQEVRDLYVHPKTGLLMRAAKRAT
jgi:hypothetical protein